MTVGFFCLLRPRRNPEKSAPKHPRVIETFTFQHETF